MLTCAEEFKIVGLGYLRPPWVTEQCGTRVWRVACCGISSRWRERLQDQEIPRFIHINCNCLILSNCIFHICQFRHNDCIVLVRSTVTVGKKVIHLLRVAVCLFVFQFYDHVVENDSRGENVSQPQSQTVRPPLLQDTRQDSLFQDQLTQEQLLPLSCHTFSIFIIHCSYCWYCTRCAFHKLPFVFSVTVLCIGNTVKSNRSLYVCNVQYMCV